MTPRQVVVDDQLRELALRLYEEKTYKIQLGDDFIETTAKSKRTEKDGEERVKKRPKNGNSKAPVSPNARGDADADEDEDEEYDEEALINAQYGRKVDEPEDQPFGNDDEDENFMNPDTYDVEEKGDDGSILFHQKVFRDDGAKEQISSMVEYFQDRYLNEVLLAEVELDGREEKVLNAKRIIRLITRDFFNKTLVKKFGVNKEMIFKRTSQSKIVKGVNDNFLEEFNIPELENIFNEFEERCLANLQDTSKPPSIRLDTFNQDIKDVIWGFCREMVKQKYTFKKSVAPNKAKPQTKNKRTKKKTNSQKELVLNESNGSGGIVDIVCEIVDFKEIMKVQIGFMFRMLMDASNLIDIQGNNYWTLAEAFKRLPSSPSVAIQETLLDIVSQSRSIPFEIHSFVETMWGVLRGGNSSQINKNKTISLSLAEADENRIIENYNVHAKSLRSNAGVFHVISRLFGSFSENVNMYDKQVSAKINQYLSTGTLFVGKLKLDFDVPNDEGRTFLEKIDGFAITVREYYENTFKNDIEEIHSTMKSVDYDLGIIEKDLNGSLARSFTCIRALVHLLVVKNNPQDILQVELPPDDSVQSPSSPSSLSDPSGTNDDDRPNGSLTYLMIEGNGEDDDGSGSDDMDFKSEDGNEEDEFDSDFNAEEDDELEDEDEDEDESVKGADGAAAEEEVELSEDEDYEDEDEEDDDSEEDDSEDEEETEGKFITSGAQSSSSNQAVQRDLFYLHQHGLNDAKHFFGNQFRSENSILKVPFEYLPDIFFIRMMAPYLEKYAFQNRKQMYQTLIVFNQEISGFSKQLDKIITKLQEKIKSKNEALLTYRELASIGNEFGTSMVLVYLCLLHIDYEFKANQARKNKDGDENSKKRRKKIEGVRPKRLKSIKGMDFDEGSGFPLNDGPKKDMVHKKSDKFFDCIVMMHIISQIVEKTKTKSTNEIVEIVLEEIDKIVGGNNFADEAIRDTFFAYFGNDDEVRNDPNHVALTSVIEYLLNEVSGVVHEEVAKIERIYENFEQEFGFEAYNIDPDAYEYDLHRDVFDLDVVDVKELCCARFLFIQTDSGVTDRAREIEKTEKGNDETSFKYLEEAKLLKKAMETRDAIIIRKLADVRLLEMLFMQKYEPMGVNLRNEKSLLSCLIGLVYEDPRKFFRKCIEYKDQDVDIALPYHPGFSEPLTNLVSTRTYTNAHQDNMFLKLLEVKQFPLFSNALFGQYGKTWDDLKGEFREAVVEFKTSFFDQIIREELGDESFQVIRNFFSLVMFLYNQGYYEDFKIDRFNIYLRELLDYYMEVFDEIIEDRTISDVHISWCQRRLLNYVSFQETDLKKFNLYAPFISNQGHLWKGDLTLKFATISYHYSSEQENTATSTNMHLHFMKFQNAFKGLNIFQRDSAITAFKAINNENLIKRSQIGALTIMDDENAQRYLQGLKKVFAKLKELKLLGTIHYYRFYHHFKEYHKKIKFDRDVQDEETKTAITKFFQNNVLYKPTYPHEGVITNVDSTEKKVMFLLKNFRKVTFLKQDMVAIQDAMNNGSIRWSRTSNHIFRLVLMDYLRDLATIKNDNQFTNLDKENMMKQLTNDLFLDLSVYKQRILNFGAENDGKTPVFYKFGGFEEEE